MDKNFDVIVVGAGHAGCEAAAAAGNLGLRVLLITFDMTKMGQMSCNPAMGGVAKGQIVREIDALGGYSGIVTDRSMIQYRMLNRSKGPAMWSPRAQCDRVKFSIEWRSILEEITNVFFWQDEVKQLILKNKKVEGVVTGLGMKFKSSTVILTNGTFLNGKIFVGKEILFGGRISEPASYGLSEQLIENGIIVERMKTGTPARIDARTIDFSVLEEQYGDSGINKFSFIDSVSEFLPQKCCYITHTNEEVHDILREGFSDSPLFSGTIKGRGPRYCPSIEDKVVTFSDKTSHQLFLEPEGVNTVEYYINGFSSSLPLHIQFKALRKIKGLENVNIFRPGYAIEYDFCPPVQLNHSLESKIIENLFFAGQINGTTGYEEAAGQGLIAGINAALKVKCETPLILKRDEAYIGVLIDDLVTKGVDEPYRMFTARAEFRILLRQDNADLRLTPIGYNLGLVNNYRFEFYKRKYVKVDLIIDYLKNLSIRPEEVNELLFSKDTSSISQSIKLVDLVLRPQIKLKDVLDFAPNIESILFNDPLRDEILESVEINIKYSGYIQREKILADKLHRLENILIFKDIAYNDMKSLSTEARQKLTKIKPTTIGQAARIPGISPSDINVLLVYHGR